jgi:hypothetical protein
MQPTILVAPTLTAQVRDLVYLQGQQQTPVSNMFLSGVIMANASGTVRSLVQLNAGGTGFIFTRVA